MSFSPNAALTETSTADFGKGTKSAVLPEVGITRRKEHSSTINCDWEMNSPRREKRLLILQSVAFRLKKGKVVFEAYKEKRDVRPH